MQFSRLLSLPFIVAVFVLLLFVLVLFSLFSGRNDTTPLPDPTPSPPPTGQQGRVRPPTLRSIPTLPSTRGAPDISSGIVRNSENHVQRLVPHLPYGKSLTTSTGILVNILIPGSEFQDDPWKLTVQIFGINYNVSPAENEYADMRQSFLEAATDVFMWIESNGADPTQVLIKWGDRAFIQERAEQWLSE